MAETAVRDLDETPTAYWVGIGLKTALVLLLLLPLARPDLEQYDGKGMSWRVAVFPLACLVVPVLWRATGSTAPFPYAADNLLVLLPLTDVLWNTIDAYDRLSGFDKVNHLGDSCLLAVVVGLWAARYPLGPVNRILIALGVGMTLQVLWEIAEYTSFRAGSSMPQTWGDTIGDLAFDLVGTLAGAGVALLVAEEADESMDADPVAAYANR